MAQIAPPRVADFRLRASYPNLYALRNSSRRRSSESGKLDRLPGYFPPVAEYRLRKDEPGRWREIELRDVDVPLLMEMTHDRGKRHLSLILQGRDGGPASRAELNATVQERFRVLEETFWGSSIRSDKCVVSSMSGGAFPADVVSHKGSILLKLSQRGYPVPDFAILTSHAYHERGEEFERYLRHAMSDLESLTTQRLGSTSNPLVLAVRCAMPRYYPGLMPTYLNAGITQGTLPALIRLYGRKAALRMYLNNLRNLLSCLVRDARFKTEEAVSSELPEEELEKLVERFTARVSRLDGRLLEDAVHQMLFLARQAYRQFDNNADLLNTLSRGENHYPSLIFQKMVCSVRDDKSYAGVLSSRNARTGLGCHLETGHNIFGEDIMTGSVPTRQTCYHGIREIKETFPAVYHFAPAVGELEREFEMPVTVEFAVESVRGHELFAMLQLNETGMTGQAAFISAVDMHKAGVISRKRVTRLVLPYHVKQIETDTIEQESFKTLERFSTGVSILPRAAVCAQVYFTSEAALNAKQRGERVCFCKQSFAPADAVVMREVDAIVSLTSAAIHVVSICQSFGVPALLSLDQQGVRLLADGGLVNAEGVEIHEGVWVTISSRRQALFRGRARLKPARFTRYLRRENIHLTDDERRSFESLAYAYRYYQQLVRGMQLEQISSLNDLIRLVNMEMRGEAEEARRFVHGWFDRHEEYYVDEVLKSDMGDHLNQHTVFDMLTPERKVRFFKLALARCAREKISGYAAGTFMLGRFISRPQPVSFWEAFTAREAALLVNEWVLFEKYLQVLYDVGERKVARARRKILGEGLENLALAAHNVANLVPLKLSKQDLNEMSEESPQWADPQTQEVLGILASPYKEFFDFKADGSVSKLKAYCAEANLSLPAPDDA